MSKSRVAITAGAVFLSAALAVSLFSNQKSKATTSEQVLTWDCETAEYKPESITITCADGGVFVEKIQWSTWSKEGASGASLPLDHRERVGVALSTPKGFGHLFASQ